MNRNRATTNRPAAQRLGLSLSSLAFWAALLIAAKSAALLIPPRPDMNTSRGSEPCISRRKRSMNVIGLVSFLHRVVRPVRGRQPMFDALSNGINGEIRQWQRGG